MDENDNFYEEKAKLQMRKMMKVSVVDSLKDLTISDLHEKRKELTHAMESFLDRVDKEKRSMTTDEDAGYKHADAYLNTLNDEIWKRTKPATPFGIGNSPTADPAAFLKVGQRRKYNELFGIEGRNHADFNSMEDFLATVTSGRSDARLEKRTFISGSGPGGGYSVPEQYAGMFLDNSLEGEIVRSRALVFPMQSESLHIPAWDGSDHSSSVFGGFTGTWMAENTPANIQTGKLRTMLLKAKKLGIYTEASREVLADGISLGMQIGPALVKACGFYLDKAFLTGAGVAQPLGVINAPSAISYNRAVASQIAYDDVIGMYARMHPSCMLNAVWIASSGTLPQLCNLRDAGSNNLWITAQAGFSQGIPKTLAGLPLLFTEKLPDLGTKGDLMLCDLSQYGIGLRQEVVVEHSNAPGWTNDVISFRAILRVDGMPLWEEAITPAGGGDTLSWAVILN